MNFRFAHVIGWSLLALVLGATGPSHAQQPASACNCDFSDLPGVVWWGTPRDMTVAELAAYAAPVFWFSPDEPSLNDAHGSKILTPDPFPFETATRPVVYFQLKEIVGKKEGGEPVFRETGTSWAEAVINTDVGMLLRLDYYAYFANEAGFGSHRHDIETIEMRIGVALSDGEYLSGLGYPDCGTPHAVIFVNRVVGKAHGIEWYWNILEVEGDAEFPMHVLVEEGKHALAPDRNGDGYFTPSYDVNVRVNDAWGVRDVIRSGGLFTSTYQAWMTKVRHPEDRVIPPLPGDSPLHGQLRGRQADAGNNQIYELRMLPQASVAADWDAQQVGKSHLERFFVGKALPDGPVHRKVSTLDEAWNWFNAGALKRSFSVSAYSDGRFGFSWTLPFFIGKNMTIPMTGGYVLHRGYAKGNNLRDFGWTLLYSNSASRWLDSYIAVGAEWYDRDPGTGIMERRTDLVVDAGFKFRTQIGHSPLSFLSFITDFWGLRLGVKNYGAFDINRFTYVVELGAGSF